MNTLAEEELFLLEWIKILADMQKESTVLSEEEVLVSLIDTK